MQNRSAECRLALLYTLEKSDMNLTEPQFARIMSETSVMNFFDLKSALHALCDGGEIEEIPTLQGSTYALTSKGSEMILSLRTDLRRSVRDAIDSYISAHASELYSESVYLSGYTRTGNGQYRVQGRIMSDGAPIFEISMTVDSREEAKTFTGRWKEKGSDIYQRILLELTV